MAETIKSVLFLDYDSIHRALAASEREAADRLASRAPAWVAAVETGTLFAEDAEPLPRRRILMRRCYADPALLGSDRSVFLANGFQVVDCPPAEGREHNAAGVHMVLDTIDALSHPTGYEEFILLSVDTDLSPLLIRLRAHNRQTAIYASPVTAESYKAIADAMIDEDRLLAVLLSDEKPKEAGVAPAAPPPAERSEIEALARKVSGATNVPLFAPRTYAELFRHLVEEIGEKGYHFQSTAENVAARMASAGRNVTRRQVVFVVKGLALKGHVFSTSDTAERLAEVFREQVVYLGENAGLVLDDKEKATLSSWIVGRIQPSAAGAAVEPEGKAVAANDEAPAEIASDRSTAPAAKPAPRPDDQATPARRKAGRPTLPVKPETPAPAAAVVPPPKPAPEPPKPPPQPAKPAAEAPRAPAPTARPPEAPKQAPIRTILASRTTITAPKPATATVKPPLSPARPLVQPGKAAPTAPTTSSARPTPAAARSGSTPAAQTPQTASDADKDAVESSILAAIAQAVDVLVEDSGVRPKPAGAATPPAPAMARPSPAPEAPAPAPPPPQPAEEEEIPEGDDIGDEIQRIIASYNRNRDK